MEIESRVVRALPICGSANRSILALRTISSFHVLNQAIEGVPLESRGFMAGTVVLVPDGWVAIERIRVGDQVLSRDAPSGKTAYRTVAEVRDLPIQDLILVRFHQNGENDDSMRIDTLAATADQAFFAGIACSGSPGWRGAGDLLDNGDKIPLAQGSYASIICADRLLATDKPEIAWSMRAWGPEPNDGSGYLADMRFRPPSVSDTASFNWGPDGGLIRDKFRAPAIGIIVQEFHSLFVGTLGAWAHDATQ
jgi:hypothetical protein